jgi:hypothetical protein
MLSEKLFVFLIFLLFVVFLSAELLEIFAFQQSGNFLLDFFYDKKKKEIDRMKDIHEISREMMESTYQKPIVWRQSIFVSVAVSVMTFLVVRIFCPIRMQCLISIFLVVFFVTMLLFNLIMYHCYGSKDTYIHYGLTKIYDLSSHG